jgi:hypothetical protein
MMKVKKATGMSFVYIFYALSVNFIIQSIRIRKGLGSGHSVGFCYADLRLQ